MKLRKHLKGVMKPNHHRLISTHIYKSLFIIVVLPVILIWCITLIAANRITLKNAMQQTQTLANQAYNVISQELTIYSEYIERIATNPTILYELYTLQHPRNQTFSAYAITSSIHTIVGNNEMIDSVEICAASGARFTHKGAITKGAISESALIQKTKLANTGNLVWSAQPKELRHIPQPYIILSKIMKYDSYSNEQAGYVFMALDYELLNQLCKQVNSEVDLNVFVTDAQGVIISHPDPQKLGQVFSSPKKEYTSNAILTTLDENKCFLSYHLCEFNGWHVYSSIAYSRFLNDIQNFILITLAVLLLFMISLMLFSRKLTLSITTPINTLIESMEKVGNREYLESNACVAESEYFYEFEHLRRHFNNMQLKIADNILEITQYKTKEHELMFLNTQSELKLLQQQINSHFISNLLETVFWMAYERQQFEISHIITALGKFFRSNINLGLEYIPVQAEIESVKNYIFLQNIRYDDRLEVQWNIDPKILNYKIIKFIIQPIVENSIVHGIEPTGTAGIISIDGFVSDDTLYFKIADNGIGMTEQELQILLENINSSDTLKKGIGIKNVHRRLRLYYGNKYGISVQSCHTKGTCVTLRIPLNTV